MKHLATLIVALVTFLSFSSTAAIPINLSSPTEFFTNLATRLVKADLSLDLNRLQVYPTNEYTPSVHRLLQVTANLYDSTTNHTLGINPEEPYCPSVFRPFFRRVLTGTNIAVVIAGYREVTNTDLANPVLAPPMIDPAQSDASLGAIPLEGTDFSSVEKNEPMVAGIPLVIGARKGFPNFNEFSMQTQIQVMRLLEFRRATGNGNGPVVETNQMYVVGISNLFGL